MSTNSMSYLFNRLPICAAVLLSAGAVTINVQAGDLNTVGSESAKDSKQPVLQRVAPKQRFYLSLGGGAEFDEHATKWLSNGEGTLIANNPNLVPNLPVVGPVALPVKITSKDFHNTHQYPVIVRTEAGYNVTEWFSVFGGFTYEHSHGNQAVRFGQVRDPGGVFGNTDAVYNLYANIGDYESYTGRAGFNLALPRTLLDFIHAPKAIKPFLSYSAGGKLVDPSHAQFYSPGLLDTGRIKLYNSSWVFTNDLQFGYEVDFTRNFGVFFQSGYGYDTKLERNSDGGRSPQAAGLTGTNKGSDRFYSTLNLSAKVKF